MITHYTVKMTMNTHTHHDEHWRYPTRADAEEVAWLAERVMNIWGEGTALIVEHSNDGTTQEFPPRARGKDENPSSSR